MGLSFSELAELDMATLCAMADEWVGDGPRRAPAARQATQADIDAFLR